MNCYSQFFFPLYYNQLLLLITRSLSVKLKSPKKTLNLKSNKSQWRITKKLVPYNPFIFVYLSGRIVLLLVADDNHFVNPMSSSQGISDCIS